MGLAISVAADKVEVEISKLLKEAQRELVGKINKNTRPKKGKDGDSYKDISVTLLIKIKPFLP